MAHETLRPAPREIKFGGEGKAEDIKRGFAITTLRNPRPAYDFKQGEVILADCFDSGEKVPVVVLTNETKRLQDFSTPQLALDGFFSSSQATDEMKNWPGYENTEPNTAMQAITFVSKDSFNKLSPGLQDEITSLDFDTIFLDDQLRRIFYPTMAYQFGLSGQGLDKWFDFIRNNNMVSRYDTRVIRKTRDENPEMSEYYISHPEAFAKLAVTPSLRFHRTFILGLEE